MILFVSQYADPCPVGSNNNVYRQAIALKHNHCVDVEILTWPEQDGWTGPLPANDELSSFSYHQWFDGELKYHIMKLPIKLLRRVPNDSDWQQGIEIGCELLKKIKPSIVHLQHWRGLWWILESAKKLSIPTVYTSHDWGLVCLRTILVNGANDLCDGIVESSKCIGCIWKGRNLIGKANELLVSSFLGEHILELFDRSFIERWLSSYGAERFGLKTRVNLHLARAVGVLSNLSALVVPSQFAKHFFSQFGIAESRIHVAPWYYDLSAPMDSVRVNNTKIVLGFVGRISPDKGVKRIFDALNSDLIPNPIHLVIAGEIRGEYAEKLHAKYTNSVGKHSVEWMGWVSHRDIHEFYEKVDVVVISSEWMDNTPLSLIESLAFKRPVIITDVPSIRDLVQDEHTGYLTKFNSTASLENAISRASVSADEISAMKNNIPKILSSFEYSRIVKNIYKSIGEKEFLHK